MKRNRTGLKRGKPGNVIHQDKGSSLRMRGEFDWVWIFFGCKILVLFFPFLFTVTVIYDMQGLPLKFILKSNLNGIKQR